jgi:nitroreductase
MDDARFVRLGACYEERSEDEMKARAVALRAEMQRRRTVRAFSSRPVPRTIIEECLLTAGSAPSGANLQPWHFVVVSDPGIKKQLREMAEREERAFYHGDAPRQWLDALTPLGTDEHKPFLEDAPYVIAVFAERYRLTAAGERQPNYYVLESVGIATGLLVAAIHHAGLAALTYTPARMGFLNRLLGRPDNERPFLLLVVGYPAPDAVVPTISKKGIAEIATFR